MFGTDKSKLYLPQKPLVEEIDLDDELIIEGFLDNIGNSFKKGLSTLIMNKGGKITFPNGDVPNLKPSDAQTLMKYIVDHEKEIKASNIQSSKDMWKFIEKNSRDATPFLYDMKKALNESSEIEETEITEEGYKIGDMVNVTNPKATARYKIIGKTKTHYHIEKPNGDKMHMPKERIARVNKERFDLLKSKVSSNRLKGSDIPIKEEIEELEEISKKTLGSYVSKASKDLGASRQIAGAAFTKKDQHPEGSKENEQNHESGWYHTDIARKRQKGIDRAVKRLTKEEIEKIEKTLNGLNESSNSLPHPYRSDLHRRKTGNGNDVIYHHITGVKDPKIAKMGHIDTSKGPGKYTAHDENGKQISDLHHDIHGALKSIAQHHIKNGNGKKFSLE